MNTPFDAVAGSAFTKMPSVEAKPVSCSSVRAFLIASLDWFAQLIGSLSMRDPFSSDRPSTGMATAMITSGSTAARCRLPSRRTVASTQVSAG